MAKAMPAGTPRDYAHWEQIWQETVATCARSEASKERIADYARGCANVFENLSAEDRAKARRTQRDTFRRVAEVLGFSA